MIRYHPPYLYVPLAIYQISLLVQKQYTLQDCFFFLTQIYGPNPLHTKMGHIFDQKKILVHNLQYKPESHLVKVIYSLVKERLCEGKVPCPKIENKMYTGLQPRPPPP